MSLYQDYYDYYYQSCKLLPAWQDILLWCMKAKSREHVSTGQFNLPASLRPSDRKVSVCV